jgi:hypothetical protein
MAETFQERQENLAIELQNLLTEHYPGGDFSVGTVLYDLLVVPAALTYASQEITLDTVRDNLSLSQVLSTADPDPALVDNLLSNYGVVRDSGAPALGLINIFTTSTQNVYISSTTEFECNGVKLKPTKAFVGVAGVITEQDTTEISYIQMRDFDTTSKVFSISAATVLSADTVLSVGQSCTSTLNSPLITKTETGSTFTGGRIEETSLALLQRARTGVNARVVTGRDNIRSLLTSQTAVSVIDAAVFGMGDDLQLRDAGNNTGISSGGRVDVYVKTSPVPVEVTQALTGTRTTGNVFEIDITSTIFPGAYGVSRVKYNDQALDISLTHVIGYDVQGPWPLIESATHARYSQYQTLTLQFETTEVPAADTEADFEVTVLYMPGVKDMQTFLDDPGIRSHSFDHVVKAVIPVIVDLDVDIEYQGGVEAPEAGVLQQTVSDIINLKTIGTEALFTSEIVYACRLAFSEGTVRMPVNLRARIYMPDGTITYTSSQNHIKAPTATGISYRNAAFFCFPNSVNVTLSEVSV